MITVRVATDFSRYPAGRFLTDGPYSGEAFRKTFLAPNLKDHDKVVVDLNGTRGYGSSFLEEAFGGLIRQGFPLAAVRSKLELVARPSLAQEIEEYLAEAAAAA